MPKRQKTTGKLKTYKIVAWNEWCTAKVDFIVTAESAKQAKEDVLNTRTADGGIISCREITPSRGVVGPI